MNKQYIFLLALGLQVLVSACAPSRFSTTDVNRLNNSDFGRPQDSLLHRPDLQAVVDAQVLRHGDELIAFLGDEDPAVRARAAFALGSVQDENAIPELLSRLADTDARVRADAAFALGQTADSSVALTLLNTLRAEPNLLTCIELVEAIGKIGGQAAPAELLEIELPQHLEYVRSLAIARFGLRDIHLPEAVAHLLSANPDHASLDEFSAYYFGRMRDTIPWEEQADRVDEAFVNMFGSDPAIQHLMLAFGGISDREYYLDIVSVLRSDPDWRNRNNAARAISMMVKKDPVPSDPLLQALDDQNPNVAVSAASGLSGAGLTQEQLEPLLRWIAENPEQPTVAAALLPAFVRADRPEAVMDWFRNQTNPFLQQQALSALDEATDRISLDFLFQHTQNKDPRLAYAALQALKARWEAVRASAQPQIERFFSAFSEGVTRGDLTTIYAAAPALSDSLFTPFDPGALLRSAYAGLEAPADTDAMIAILDALAKIRDGQGIKFLVDTMMQAEYPPIREAAENALNERLVDGVDVEHRTENVSQTILIDWDQLAEYGPRPLLTLFTDYGPIVIEMDAEQAPQTVQKIIRSTVRGDYNNVPFHRVVPNFVIQGGDYFRQDGFGGPDVAIRSEFTRIRYRTGTAGMASSGKDTEGVQYFITHSMQPHLDGRYTAFGHVVHGQEAVDQMRQGDVVVEARITRDER